MSENVTKAAMDDVMDTAMDMADEPGSNPPPRGFVLDFIDMPHRERHATHNRDDYHRMLSAMTDAERVAAIKSMTANEYYSVVGDDMKEYFHNDFHIDNTSALDDDQLDAYLSRFNYLRAKKGLEWFASAHWVPKAFVDGVLSLLADYIKEGDRGRKDEDFEESIYTGAYTERAVPLGAQSVVDKQVSAQSDNNDSSNTMDAITDVDIADGDNGLDGVTGADGRDNLK